MMIYNTLTRNKQKLNPIIEGEVRIYCCGPTVYNFFHIGNARPLIIFDTLRRYLSYIGYNVIFVQNFTDIDDKMINRANEEGISVKQLADKFINEYYTDARGLGIQDATYTPRATECIQDIVDMIKKLEQHNYAYRIGGNMYFDTQKFADYGKLSHRDINELEMGARVEINEKKRSPMDFVLWKNHKPQEPAWNSPWGIGRPGWHIECSVMANKFLGETIDIHCGGQDLIFPHHENEIAQSEAANSKPFANYWMHNGFVNINNKKMSKSEGNFFTVRDIIKRGISYEAVRFFMLSAHYRSPIDFSIDLLNQAQNGLNRLYSCVNNLISAIDFSVDESILSTEENSKEQALRSDLLLLKKRFIQSMDDDLNTAEAISFIFEIVKKINLGINFSSRDKVSKELLKYCIALLKELTELLGILQTKQTINSADEEVEMLIKERQAAREKKDWKLADEIRDRLKEIGIILEDTPNGVRWKRVPR